MAPGRGPARRRGAIAVGFIAACALIAEASCGFVLGSSTSFAGSSSMKSIPKQRKAGRIAAAGAPRQLDAAGKKYILGSIKHDLENQWDDGFVFTPFSPDVLSSNPFMEIKGRGPSEVLKTASPLNALHKFMSEGSATFRIKNIVEAAGDVNPFDGLASPPRHFLPAPAEGAAWAVHATWEIEAQGRIQLAPVIEQKPFYLSGHDVFRMDASGRVISHEKGFDQDLASVVAYFIPVHHIPSLDNILPIAIAQKTEA